LTFIKYNNVDDLHHAGHVPVVIGVDLDLGSEGMEAENVADAVLGSFDVAHSCVVDAGAPRANGVGQCGEDSTKEDSIRICNFRGRGIPDLP